MFSLPLPLPKTISKCCELVKVCRINYRGPTSFETQRRHMCVTTANSRFAVALRLGFHHHTNVLTLLTLTFHTEMHSFQ